MHPTRPSFVKISSPGNRAWCNRRPHGYVTTSAIAAPINSEAPPIEQRAGTGGISVVATAVGSFTYKE